MGDSLSYLDNLLPTIYSSEAGCLIGVELYSVYFGYVVLTSY